MIGRYQALNQTGTYHLIFMDVLCSFHPGEETKIDFCTK